MLKEIEQLLRLQERDQKIKMFKAELETVPFERQRIEQFVAAKSSAFDRVKQQSRDVEVQRKMLELDAQSRRDSIAKYKIQQYQTRKNDEFQAISQEIHRFEQEIERIEDHEIELMEQTEQFQKETAVRGVGVESCQTAIGAATCGLEKERVHFGRAFETGRGRE